jgi:hypothetical protein
LLPPLGNNTKYQVTIAYNLFSWDSYVALGPPGTGYWDSFSMSVSPSPYQDLGLSDPLTTANLPGLGFVWGGSNFGDSLLECNPSTDETPFGCASVPEGQAVITMQAGAGANYLNIVLDTKTLPEGNHAHPSFGKIRILSVVAVP